MAILTDLMPRKDIGRVYLSLPRKRDCWRVGLRSRQDAIAKVNQERRWKGKWGSDRGISLRPLSPDRPLDPKLHQQILNPSWRHTVCMYEEGWHQHCHSIFTQFTCYTLELCKSMKSLLVKTEKVFLNQYTILLDEVNMAQINRQTPSGKAEVLHHPE